MIHHVTATISNAVFYQIALVLVQNKSYSSICRATLCSKKWYAKLDR